MLTEVQVTQLGSWTVVAPIGELDLASVPQLRQAVVAVVGSGHHDVVVDLAAVDFIDSVGLGGVVAVAKRVLGHGGRFRVARPDARVWAVFALVGLDRVIECHVDLDSAVESAVGSAVDAAVDATGLTSG
jgi:anti-sigma B factor antagonist